MYLAAFSSSLAVGTAGCIDGGDNVGETEYESGYLSDEDVREADIDSHHGTLISGS